jgi:hypothetical protein
VDFITMSRFKSNYPTSENCPHCGSGESKKRPPETYIAFVSDRVCKVCQTRYTPPTPAWAAIIFILVGMLFVGVDVLFLVTAFIRPGMGFTSSFLQGWVGASVALLGIACIVHGLRSLTRSQKKKCSESIPKDGREASYSSPHAFQ